MGCIIILALGIYFSFRFRFPQLLGFTQIVKSFFKLATQKEDKKNIGVSPLKAFFSSIGGCIGIGNIVAVCTAVQIGGPGAVFWMWVAAFLGALLKYAEVYLGIKFRVKNEKGGYDGGPMFFLQHVVKSKWLPLLVAFLLCIYGTEVYIFNTIVETIAFNWSIKPLFLIPTLLVLIFYAGSGGVERVGKICSIIIPIFIVIFSIMGSYVLLLNYKLIIPTLSSIITSAFSGHAAIGAFTGSTIQLAITQGIARGCYTGDLGVGFASVLHAETSLQSPEKQASLSIFGIFLDTFVICTCSTLLVLVTGIWQENLPAAILVQTALSKYFSMMHLFMPFFIFLVGYSTMISFFCVGLKSAHFIHRKYGPYFYYLFSAVTFIACSFIESKYALTLMSLSGVSLLLVNSIGIFLLRKEIKFPKFK
jgi:AGCS family alanine or glycine:cation symporter